jgi:5,10-methylenetetrahydromethanopterin reductase
MRWIEQQMGLPFVRPLTTTKEAVAILRRLLAGERLTFEGKSFHIRDVALSFEPLRRRVPIWLGVKGAAALRAAGAIADGVILSALSSPVYVRWARERIAEGARGAGRTPEDIEVAAYVLVSAGEDRERARGIVRPVLSYYMGVHYDHAIMREAGFLPEEMFVFRRALLEHSDASSFVTDRMLDALAVAGTPSECRERMNELIAAGVSEPVCFEVPGVPLAETMGFARDQLAH